MRSLVALSVVMPLGAAGAQAKSLAVPRDFPTIQAAVDAASPGDRVSVGKGVFTEEVVIAKDLELRGAGIGASAIRSPATLHQYGTHVPSGRALTAIVRVWRGAHVRMSGLTVRGPIPCGVEVSGINVLQGATLDIKEARVTGIQADPATCAPNDAAGRAVVFGIPPHVVVDGADGSTAFGSIRHVTVDHFQHAGISLTGPAAGDPSRVVAADNIVSGGWTLPSFQYGFHITAGVVARVTGNRIAGVTCGGPFCGPDPMSQVQSPGIGVESESAVPQVAITGNRISGSDVGIYQVVSPKCCRIADNLLTDNRFFGIVIQDGDGATQHNRISGGQTGIGVVADFVDTTAVLQGDRITGTSLAPIRELECCGFAATAITR